MLDTTKDLFWLIAGVSLGAFTFFVCWSIYYLVMMLKDARKIILSVRTKIDLIDNILKLLKEKLEKTSSHMTVITETILKLAGFFMDHQPKGKKKK